MEATIKNPSIDKVLTQMMGKNRLDTVRENLCMTCDGYATEFKDKISKKEYTISGMCQDCQDRVFG
jgi:hypothetical protein